LNLILAYRFSYLLVPKMKDLGLGDEADFINNRIISYGATNPIHEIVKEL
jgi:hypothetical protein